MGRSKIAALRVQPGEIISIEDADEALRAWGKMLNHNCFTLVGNGGSPVIDLETGEVLAYTYGWPVHSLLGRLEARLGTGLVALAGG